MNLFPVGVWSWSSTSRWASTKLVWRTSAVWSLQKVKPRADWRTSGSPWWVQTAVNHPNICPVTGGQDTYPRCWICLFKWSFLPETDTEVFSACSFHSSFKWWHNKFSAPWAAGMVFARPWQEFIPPCFCTSFINRLCCVSFVTWARSKTKLTSGDMLHHFKCRPALTISAK